MVLTYPRVVALLPAVSGIDTSGAIGQQIGEAIELARDYRGYVWSQWFRQTPTSTSALFAALLGTGGLVSASGGSLFMLSLPATRMQLMAVRAGSGLAQWLVLGARLVAGDSLVVAGDCRVLSVGTALVHALCVFTGGAVIYSLALFLSTLFGDLWRPWLIALAIAMPITFAEQMARSSTVGLSAAMTGEQFFRTGQLPWAALTVAAAASAALLYAAALNFTRRDF